MKFVVAGAGAIGAFIGAKMARAGYDVTLFARGAHCRAMQERGVRVLSPEGDFEVHPRVVDSLAAVGPVDVIFLAVKAHSLPALAPQLPPLLDAATTVVSMQNGIPWWYFSGPERLETLDPGGAISSVIDERRVIGSIIYLSTETVEPGVIRHNESTRITLGEPDGSRSDRCRAISEALVRSGLRAPITTHIRQEIWVKLLGNIAFNPISALTGATLVRIARHPDAGPLVRAMMAETEALARQLGIEMPITIEQRMAGAEKVGEHKTSMLQDLEAGRTLELDAIVGAALELGARLKVSMPHTRAVYACTRLLESQRKS
ncbi:MAG TPA: 2-dehydropantoate 2-reductase [Bryobacteraceae bacterium]|nr:2-dehydropantoate 2-reductase [Bryobacteraceae bacterium]